MYCFCRFLYMYICWDYNYPSVYFGSCLCLFVYFLSSHSFLYLFMCPKIFLFSLFYKHSSIFLQLSLHHPKKMEVFFFFFFCDMVVCCQGTISCSASPSQSRKNLVKSVNLFRFYPFGCELLFGLLVCVCGKQYDTGTETNSRY